LIETFRFYHVVYDKYILTTIVDSIKKEGLVDIHIKLIAIKSKKSWKITKGELLTTSGPYPWSIVTQIYSIRRR
jgi:hypothetical protein